MEAITLKPIGVVRSPFKRRSKRDAKNLISNIVVDSGLTEALYDIEDYSEIIVLYWFHHARKLFPMKVHPRRDTTIPLKGVLATRSPDRPNPIGMTIVSLLKHKDNVLTVKGLDAIDGTPVIDIKPYAHSTEQRNV